MNYNIISSIVSVSISYFELINKCTSTYVKYSQTNGNLVNNILHNISCPSDIIVVKDTVIKKWYYNGKIHRDGGPAVIHFSNGNKFKELWYHYGNVHRDDGPAEIFYRNYKGTDYMTELFWFHENILHREDGPAVIYYSIIDGVNVINAKYWLKYGEEYKKNGVSGIYYDLSGDKIISTNI